MLYPTGLFLFPWECGNHFEQLWLEKSTWKRTFHIDRNDRIHSWPKLWRPIPYRAETRVEQHPVLWTETLAFWRGKSQEASIEKVNLVNLLLKLNIEFICPAIKISARSFLAILNFDWENENYPHERSETYICYLIQ